MGQKDIVAIKTLKGTMHVRFGIIIAINFLALCRIL